MTVYRDPQARRLTVYQHQVEVVPSDVMAQSMTAFVCTDTSQGNEVRVDIAASPVTAAETGVTFTVRAGQVIVVAATKIYETGTTAAGVVALS